MIKKRRLIMKIAGGLLGSLILISGIFRKEKRKMFSSDHITGLYFHNPSFLLFERCIRWLKKNNCTFISSHQLSEILQKKQGIPPRAVWLTFDDGWQENLQLLPIIDKYQLPITFFISAGPVKHGFFWFSLARRFKALLPLLYKKDINQLWQIEENKRKKIIKDLEKELISKGFSFEKNREAMTAEEIMQLAKIPSVTFGSHTINHVITANCTEEEIRSELLDSKTQLEAWTGKKIQFFSYPNGNFDGQEISILKKSNFELAATTKKEFISLNADPYLVPRFCVNDDAFFTETLCQLVGVWGKAMNQINKISYFKKLSKTGAKHG